MKPIEWATLESPAFSFLNPAFFLSKLSAALLLVIGIATAQTPTAPYKPVPGQPGKDVVWIPTPEDTVEKMLDMAQVTPRDYVIDLGSGDGRNVIAAARRGARALGVEYNPDLVALSKRAAAAGVADKTTFVHGDLFEADISQATVLMLFLLPEHLARLAPKFLQLRPGARVVSNTYGIGGGWEPDAETRGEPCTSWCVAVMYVVPARVAGAWRLADGSALTLEQDFQTLSGTLETHGFVLPVENGRLRGEDIRFTVNRVDYAGRVTGNTMAGSATGRDLRPWSATLGN